MSVHPVCIGALEPEIWLFAGTSMALGNGNLLISSLRFNARPLMHISYSVRNVIDIDVV